MRPAARVLPARAGSELLNVRNQPCVVTLFLPTCRSSTTEIRSLLNHKFTKQ